MNTDSFKLTLEQEFQIKMMEHAAQSMSHNEVVDLLLEISQHLMIKDNLLRDMLKKDLLTIG